ncbi:MAG: hypothetical protein QW330_01750 [Nitrososphaerota archaeon]
MPVDRAGDHFRWWIAYTQPLPSWEVNDLEMMRNLIAEKPPNKAIEHPSLVGFLAGYFQAVGEMGYLEMELGSERIYVPFAQLTGEKEVIEKIVRLVGDAQEIAEERNSIRTLFTGLRAIIFLRIISPFLLGKARELADEMISNGYKISDVKRAEALLNRLQIEKVEEVQREPIRILKKTCKRR